jgi:asparaginyl-tRNA synthetase
MKRTKIVDVLRDPKIGETYVVKGWVRAFRSNRFVQLNDGSTINNLQGVIDFEQFDETTLKKITTAAAVGLTGTLIASQGSGQAVELKVSSIEIIGEAHPDDVQKTQFGIFTRASTFALSYQYLQCRFSHSPCSEFCHSPIF